MDLTTAIGGFAAFCTTASYFPQLKKCWQTGKAGDLSLKMFLILATGVALWSVYGFLKGDIVIIAANTISFALLTGILYFKIREESGRGSMAEDAPKLSPDGPNYVEGVEPSHMLRDEA